jgi:hypothetical protein
VVVTTGRSVPVSCSQLTEAHDRRAAPRTLRPLEQRVTNPPGDTGRPSGSTERSQLRVHTVDRVRSVPLAGPRNWRPILQVESEHSRRTATGTGTATTSLSCMAAARRPGAGPRSSAVAGGGHQHLPRSRFRYQEHPVPTPTVRGKPIARPGLQQLHHSTSLRAHPRLAIRENLPVGDQRRCLLRRHRCRRGGTAVVSRPTPRRLATGVPDQ